ncbi:keratinocyte differentiation factor 1 [Clarias gariepinus]|uniref:keratinocyte differentiation factor 1 n=1 Tax=Clarias gariepinus TaxID=13013 RepID=UPI00234E1258|nr:keratinocyte differentiation factor 1 [Clarias gariepinus]XP_053346115.1 keratinocyte differentiation factor 1 [Clarias gariepinus]
MSGSGKSASQRRERAGSPDPVSVQSARTNGRRYEERCVDPISPETRYPGAVHKVHQKDANGNTTEPESVSFLPGKKESPSGSCTCGPCVSVKSCRTFACSVLTCGLYRMCRRMPCLLPGEARADHSEVVRAAPSTPNDEDDFYSDLRIAGVKVDQSTLMEERESVSFSLPKPDADSRSGSKRFSDLQDEDFIYEDTDEDVDSLITRKLLEVFSEFEINELAKCTSDSMFLRRSQEISQIISDIVHEHKIKEQEAECRLVREIIRISTRKSKKKTAALRQQEPQRDSGNDTWRSSKRSSKKNSFNSMNDGSLKISEERSDDIEARNLRYSSKQSYMPSFPASHLPSSTDTTPVTSDTPLLFHGVRA